VRKSSNDDDVFMEDVHMKPIIKLKGKGVVRKTTGHDDVEGGQPSEIVTPASTERRQLCGCHSVYKSTILTNDSEDPGAMLKQSGRGRGGARGVGQGNG
jgi:hypothetical protein